MAVFYFVVSKNPTMGEWLLHEPKKLIVFSL